MVLKIQVLTEYCTKFYTAPNRAQAYFLILTGIDSKPCVLFE